MKGSIFTLFLLSFLLAISEVKSEGSLKLCGKDFIRAIIYICGASRWRRHLEGSLPVQQAERRNYFHLPNEHEVSEEITVHNLPKPDSTVEELAQDGQLPRGDVWEPRKHSVKSRRDLSVMCCTAGCSMADLSSFC
ncbi:insulin-like peptide INSL5 [Trichechus inunguis]|uniref:Insulin-like peptide INSL5 n=1 Tax=Trichechus manatus latirostris TaxID=127582 RepID=A0A2Y9D7G3_TRIMA|nr:insulin-like peptide INSL5 [Trichechus manatus latirostris]